MAMGIDKSTLGSIHISGCQARDETGDYVGGTTLPQVAAVAESHGVHVDLYVGANVIKPYDAAVRLQAGRGFVLQGNAGAMVHSAFRSTGGPVNHAVWVNDCRGGTVGHPSEARVFDPAADGRHASWGTAATSPGWWPWALVQQFALELHPWGDTDNRLLGPGKFYAGFLPDTEPHVHLRSGAVRSKPFPDRTRIDRVGGQWAYKSPAYGIGNRARRYNESDLFVAFQYVKGWAGNHDGNEWVPIIRLRHVGGST